MVGKRALLRLAAHSGLAALARASTGAQLRILCYHGLWTTPGPVPGRHMWLTPELFAHRMARLRASGVPVLALDEAIDLLAQRRLPRRAVVITIDDGWWSTWTHMLPVFERFDLPATLYATTWYAGRELPVVNVAVDYFRQAARTALDAATESRAIDALPLDERLPALRALGRRLGVDEAWLPARQFHLMGAAELADARARGLDIQLHTHRHIDVTAQVDALARELEENRAALAKAVDAAALAHFCYPSGTHHPRAPALLAAAGVRSATLVDEGLNPPGADPYRLRRFLDGQAVSEVEFDAYLSGTLHYLSLLRGFARPGNRAATAAAVVSQA